MSLLTIIKKSPNIRKIFGKRELIIVEKQLLGVPLKQSEKTRLSRDIRKKLEAIKELARFEDDFKLKKGAEIKNLIQEAKTVILENKLFSRIKRIMLYGSYVENKLRLNSDIDMAVEFTNITNEEVIKFRKEVLGKVNEKLDIQVFNVLPKNIKKEITSKGKTIYEKSN